MSRGVYGMPGTLPTARGTGGTQPLEGLEVYRNLYFRRFVQSIIAKFRGMRRIPVWQCVLAFSTALALLASLLWLVPWQGQHDGPVTIPQPMPVQGSDHTAEETAQPTLQPLASPTAASAVPSQVPEAGTAHGEDVPLSPALLPEKSEASGAAPALPGPTPAISEKPTEVLDMQAMQGLVTRLETARSTPEERLDTQAMDNLLARLEPADKSTLPTARRSKVARKRGARSLPRAAAGRGTPGTTSPPRSDPVPLRPALEFQFLDAPKPVHDSIP